MIPFIDLIKGIRIPLISEISCKNLNGRKYLSNLIKTSNTLSYIEL